MSRSTVKETASRQYAAGALFALALNQAQIHQICPLGVSTDLNEDDGGRNSEERSSSSSSADSVSDDPQLWVHPSSGLLRPVFRYLEIDSRAWEGLEETAIASPAKSHIGAFLRLLAEESVEISETAAEEELALMKAVDSMSLVMESITAEHKRGKQLEYENECRKKFSTPDKNLDSESDDKSVPGNSEEEINFINSIIGEVPDESTSQSNKKPSDEWSIPEESICESDKKPSNELTLLSYPRKVTVLYELLSGCLANIPEDNQKTNRRRRGYDARHRVALRLLATWLNVEWIKMDAIETIVACSAMAFLKEEESKAVKSEESAWTKWKRGGIIGAAALTGGTLLAVTGGLAAPAIAAGFSALVPTLGTIVPVIGASGFAAVASAAGSVAGSVAVAASFGAAGAGLTGTKMARRMGGIDEFEFKSMGQKHNQGQLGVEIAISGFVFEEKDFIRPWEGQKDNMDRYALQWESKHLIAVSTGIQDWLTSALAMEIMRRGAMMTALHSLLTAMAWPATLLYLADFIDSKWAVALDRSDKAGKMLADVLSSGLQGHRPVTLVGFSLGARVIFRCLQILAESDSNAGIVERVVLLGAPIRIRDMNWEATRKVVAGRYINAYSSNDLMLGVAFRASLLTQGLAGIQPVNVPGIENVDVTDMIDGHSSYLWRSEEIIEHLELDTYYPVFNGAGRALVKSSSSIRSDDPNLPAHLPPGLQSRSDPRPV